MELTDDDVQEILDLIDQSHFDYFRLESAEFNLTVSRGGYVPPALPQSAPVAAVLSPAPAPSVPMAPEPAASDAGAAAEQPAASQPAAREGHVPVAAPMVGTFYRAPDPGAPSFVDVGDRVDADTTVGLIEVMKVFTSIPAGVAGTVAEIVVENAQFVEKGTILFYLTPDSASAGEAGPP